MKVLVFSSTEGLGTAAAVKAGLTRLGHEVRVWNELVFLPGQILVNALIDSVPSFDAAVLVMTPDCSLTHRGEVFDAPGDNLVLELGICLGALGPERTFVLAPADQNFRMPSDIRGLLYTSYNAAVKNRKASVQSACDAIAAAIPEGNRQFMSWRAYEGAVQELSRRIMAHSAYGGYRPDLVIGVNPGGSIVGGLLYLLNRRSFAFSTVWPLDPSPLYADISREVGETLRRGGDLAEARILIVDDSLKTGLSMRAAVEKVKSGLGDMRHTIRTAVLVYRPEFNTVADGFQPDYFLFDNYSAFPYCNV